jgi:hypothetical protein
LGTYITINNFVNERLEEEASASEVEGKEKKHKYQKIKALLDAIIVPFFVFYKSRFKVCPALLLLRRERGGKGRRTKTSGEEKKKSQNTIQICMYSSSLSLSLSLSLSFSLSSISPSLSEIHPT